MSRRRCNLRNSQLSSLGCGSELPRFCATYATCSPWLCFAKAWRRGCASACEMASCDRGWCYHRGDLAWQDMSLSAKARPGSTHNDVRCFRLHGTLHIPGILHVLGCGLQERTVAHVSIASLITQKWARGPSGMSAGLCPPFSVSPQKPGRPGIRRLFEK